MSGSLLLLRPWQALVRAIEALETIDHIGWLERAQVWLLLQAYRRWLRAIVAMAPGWLAEEMLSVSLGGQRSAPDHFTEW